jgi:hypothetical protein
LIWRHRAPLLIFGSDLGESVRANGWGDTTVAPLTAHLSGNDTAEGGASDGYVDGGDGDDRADLGGAPTPASPWSREAAEPGARLPVATKPPSVAQVLTEREQQREPPT